MQAKDMMRLRLNGDEGWIEFDPRNGGIMVTVMESRKSAPQQVFIEATEWASFSKFMQQK